MTATQRMTTTLKAVHDAPQNSPWFYTPIGLAVVGFAGVMWYRAPEQWKVWAGVGVLGLAGVRGFLPFVAKQVAPLLALWKAKNGGDSASSGNGSSGSAP